MQEFIIKYLSSSIFALAFASAGFQANAQDAAGPPPDQSTAAPAQPDTAAPPAAATPDTNAPPAPDTAAPASTPAPGADTSAPSTIQLNSHFSVGTPDGARIAKVTLVRLGAPTHGFDENQRYLEVPFITIPNGIDVTAPTSPNVAPPGHYMLFLIDAAGIPSVSAMVRIPAPWE